MALSRRTEEEEIKEAKDGRTERTKRGVSRKEMIPQMKSE